MMQRNVVFKLAFPSAWATSSTSDLRLSFEYGLRTLAGPNRILLINVWLGPAKYTLFWV